jgi:thiol-disulfide isomerase/thioredoxin
MRKSFLILALVLFAQQGLAQNLAAPAFTLPDTDGTQVTLPRTHEGVDIYYFWASWCPYCKTLMPHLQSMRIEYGDAVTIYALNIRDDEMPELFMLEHGYDFVLIPEADSIMEAYDVQATPALFIVDGQGKIRFNLYDMFFDDSSEFKALTHGQKAARRAPYWAAEIRKKIDQVLSESRSD